jgi:NADH:ubiquinone oxidoreductase subunit H
MLARAVAGGARIVRARTQVRGRSRGLRFAARAVACIALASALALVPFASGTGGLASAVPLVVVDLHHGLVALVVFVLLAALADVAVGLTESSAFARLACVRLAGRVLALAGTLAIVLAPLALASDALRLSAIVADQQGAFAPFALLATALGSAVPERGSFAALLERVHAPAWHLLRQPLTALLFVPVVGLLTRRPLAADPIGGQVRLSALGHDDDPVELYWARMTERLSSVLFAALFVALFLGAGSLPFLRTDRLVAPLAPFFGEGLPAVLASTIEVGAFFAKLVVVLALGALVSRRMASLRDDQWIRIVTRRILPLGLSNLLLVAGALLWLEAARRGGGG